MNNIRIKKCRDFYFKATVLENGFGYVIYDKYGKDRHVLESSDEPYDTISIAESMAIDAISYHYE